MSSETYLFDTAMSDLLDIESCNISDQYLEQYIKENASTLPLRGYKRTIDWGDEISKTKKGIKPNHDGFLGKKHSEETRQKMSLAHSGDKHHLFGKHRSDDVKKKLSDSIKNLPKLTCAVCGKSMSKGNFIKYGHILSGEIHSKKSDEV